MRWDFLQKRFFMLKKILNIEEISAGKQQNLLILAGKGSTFLHCLSQLLKAEVYRVEKT